MADPPEWLRQHTPSAWISLALSELRRAEVAYAEKDARAGLAAARRGAGMALNAVLLLESKEGWGRSYVDHLSALCADETAPAAVRLAAERLVRAPSPSSDVVVLRTAKSESDLLEGARDVVAHAYAVLAKHGGSLQPPGAQT